MKPEEDNFYEAFRNKSGKINPLLAAMCELKEPDEIDRFIRDYASSFGNGGRNRQTYNHQIMRNKNGSREIEDLVYSQLSSIFNPYQDEIRSASDGEMKVENWGRCLKKLVKT